MSNQKLELEIKDEAYLCELNITVEQCILYKEDILVYPRRS